MADTYSRNDYYLETDFQSSTDKCIESPLPIALDVIGELHFLHTHFAGLNSFRSYK